MYPGHLQGVTSLVNVYSVFGKFLYITAEYIYIYIYCNKTIIYDKLPNTLYMSTRLLTP
jgi:hypothetical protein